MPLVATETGGGQRQIAPAGTHVARCVQVIDLGTQPGSAKFPAPKHKIRISWELPDEKAVFVEERGEEPFMASKNYTLSLSDKATMRHDLESWRGKSFTAEELKGFDITKLLDVPCLLTIVHETKGDKVYANINSVSKMAKGMSCAARVNPLVKYEIENGRDEVFEALPEWLQNTIAGCDEWSESEPDAPDKHPSDDDDDKLEIPF